jgi:hypothetical protein
MLVSHVANIHFKNFLESQKKFSLGGGNANSKTKQFLVPHPGVTADPCHGSATSRLMSSMQNRCTTGELSLCSQMLAVELRPC